MCAGNAFNLHRIDMYLNAPLPVSREHSVNNASNGFEIYHKKCGSVQGKSNEKKDVRNGISQILKMGEISKEMP